MFTKCTGDLWARCTRYLAPCTPLPADLYAWADVCYAMGQRDMGEGGKVDLGGTAAYADV